MSENYNVGIRVSLIDKATAGLAGLITRFGAAEGAAAGLKRELKGIERSLMVGTMQVGFGAAIIASFKPAIDQAKRFQQEVAKFSLYGMGEQATAEAAKFAKSMNVMGSSYVDNMRLMNEAQGIFRESGKLTLKQQLEGAKIAAPILAKLAFIESGLSPSQRASRHAQDLAMLRFIEARGGANDPREFASIADWGYRLMQSSGGVVSWSQLQRMIAQAGPMSRTLTEDAISALEPVIADLGGGRVGSGLRVSFQRLLGTQRLLPKQAVAEYLKLGFWDPSKVELSKGGSVKQFLGAPGSVFKYSQQFMADTPGFFFNTFLPAIAKKYGDWILGSDVKAVSARAVEEALVFGPGTASQLFAQMDKLAPTIQRSLAAQRKQLGIDPSVAATGKTMAGKEVALWKQFKDLLETTGELALPLAVKGLEALQPPLKWLNDFGQAHPRLFGFVIDGLVTLAGLSIGAGVLNLFKGIGGLVRIIAPIASSEGLLGSASLLSKLPLIGPALGDAALDVGIFLGAITAPEWASIAGVAALVGAFAIALKKVNDNAPAATKRIQQQAKTGAAQFVSAFAAQITHDLNAAAGAMKKAWTAFDGWLNDIGTSIVGWVNRMAARLHAVAPWLFAAPAPAHPRPANQNHPQHPMTAAQAGASFGRFIDGSALPGVRFGRDLVPWALRKFSPDLARSNDRLSSAVNGLSAKLPPPSPHGLAPSSYTQPPQVHLHVHGVSDPHRLVREVHKLLSGPQRGGSVYDPSAVMPQVASRSAA